MADKKITELSADTSPSHDDLMITVKDPGGTPVNKKVTLVNVTGAPVNAQTGTSYTILTGDYRKLLTFTNASAIAVTLPQAGASFPANWYCFVQNRGAGAVTITPTTSTIDGAASIVLNQSEGIIIFSDGTNYFTLRGRRPANPMTTAEDIIKGGTAGVETRLAKGSNGDVLQVVAGAVAWGSPPSGGAPGGAAGGDLAGTYPNPTVKSTLKTKTLIFIFDGGGSVIETGIHGDLPIHFDGVIQSAELFADQSGSIVIDVWKDTYANFPPTDADSITASAPPTISSAQKSQDSTLTGWTTTLTAGDVLRFNVDSVSTVERVTLALKVLAS